MHPMTDFSQDYRTHRNKISLENQIKSLAFLKDPWLQPLLPLTLLLQHLKLEEEAELEEAELAGLEEAGQVELVLEEEVVVAAVEQREEKKQQG